MEKKELNDLNPGRGSYSGDSTYTERRRRDSILAGRGSARSREPAERRRTAPDRMSDQTARSRSEENRRTARSRSEENRRTARSTNPDRNRRGSSSRSRRRGPGKDMRKGPRIILSAIIILFLLLSVFFCLKAVVGRLMPDKTPPVIELTRKQDYFAASADKYEEEGFTAVDDRDGDLTGSVKRSVDGNSVRYEVSDRAGNITVEYRDIPIKEGSLASDEDEGNKEALSYSTDLKNIDPGYVPDDKVIYLTFDDGPGEYTEKLLETLKRYNVHATFFVTGAFPDYEYMIRKEYEEGHSIGVHTYSHNFAEIYSDTEAFWKDFEKVEDVIEEQTGHRTSLMRFAGGSSNTMSAQYSQGIMAELIKEAGEKGYHYFDWNVSSGDGGADCTGEQVVNNVIRQVRENSHSVVLCHDTKDYTVNNIEYVIAWALENGYTFLPLNETSPEVHHDVLN